MTKQIRVHNRIGWRERLNRIQGAAVHYDLRPLDAALAEINRLEQSVTGLSDAAIADRAATLRRQAQDGVDLAALQAPFYALAREASRRTLGLRPFDEQVVAALVLHDGHVVEMQTGEGKTLAAVMAAALTALSGRGVHVLTFNDYLARRDAEWMGPLYGMLGVSVGYVQQGLDAAVRRRAYGRHVTYVTAKEAGFDHLRDLLAMDARDVVHRPLHFALVDEADSLLIDEARIPMVIAAGIGLANSLAPRLARLVASLIAGVHFDTDEYARDVELTEAGIEHVERELGCGSLHAEENYRLLTQLNCALHARALLRRDVDYIVRDGRVEIVDEFTGRVVEDRQWPDGLQGALEAKEQLPRREEGRIVGSMTMRRFLNRYGRLCGMSGTAQGCATELRQLYGLEVTVIPTHRPRIRADLPDVVFTHREAKERALVEEIRRVARTRRPVLVGTLTVEESDRLARRLEASGTACRVLNARNDAAEARIVAGAGALGAITISTNMAGRGTDIRLGGENEADRDRVIALGGLYVIGTNRHESRRVDLQLRGRAGRQGDPGESRFFVSLEDDLLVRYGIRNLIPADAMPPHSDAPIDNPLVRREIARAQRIIEGQNLEMRRTLYGYSSVVEDQNEALMTRRQALLLDAASPDVWRRAPARRAALVSAVGEDSVRRAEKTVTLFQIDRAWSDHLALCADLREGIHLVRLGGQEPLARFTAECMRAFMLMDRHIDEAVLAMLNEIRVNGNDLDLAAAGVRIPSSTWTYLVTDDPFSNQLGRLLTAPGGVTLAMYSAWMLMPLFVLWGLVDRCWRRRRAR